MPPTIAKRSAVDKTPNSHTRIQDLESDSTFAHLEDSAVLMGDQWSAVCYTQLEKK